MAKPKYEGPYVVEKVTQSYDGEIEGYQVVSKSFSIPDDPRPRRTVNSPIYPHRQSAYRRATVLNRQWIKKHQQSLQASQS